MLYFWIVYPLEIVDRGADKQLQGVKISSREVVTKT